MSMSSTVEIVADGASEKMVEGTKIAFSALTVPGTAEHYVAPVVRYFQLKYRQSPFPIRMGKAPFEILVVL
ncbi:hypothetical protein BGZ51_003323 [Haplosporangium sp. Z 767]|nr:hypothetical protein BGZ51_003323 [Haplosporangium sp. Z 767]KAF9191956.1 hypothetical protein BGZ50_008971 [Haplosporangium sp. Z 11]